MSTSTIANFLVKLGFQVNNTQQQQFTSAMRNATAQGVLLADSMEAAARAIINFGRSVATGLEDLYYASQRTGIAVGALKNMSYAMTTIGGSANSMQQALESLAASINKTPGYNALINAFLGGQGRGESLEKRMDLLLTKWKAMWDQGGWMRSQAIQQAEALQMDQRILTQV